MKIIQQGAEAKIIRNGDFVVKDRIKKSYRIKELDDKIRKLRTRSETKLLHKAHQLIPCPLPLTDSNKSERGNERAIIKMPFIDGKKLSEHLDNFLLKEQKQICKTMGQEIAKLHNADIIHGDLTTSNMILVDDKVYFIDFGLGYISRKIEDKAVDLHLLKQALEAKHFKNWKELFEKVIEKYKKENKKEAQKVLERLKAVEKRGRYKKH